MCLCFNIFTCPCITVLIFTLDYVSPFWHSYMVMCDLLIFTLGLGSSCWFPQLVKFPNVDIHIWSCISVLKVTLGHVSHSWYSHLVMYTLLISTLGYVINVLVFSFGNVTCCWYSHLKICSCVGIHTWL